MKYKKSELDIFLQERIRENEEELCRNLDATLQYEQNCLEEIVNGIRHCKSNIEKCNKALEKASISNMAVWNAKKGAFKDNLVIWNTLGLVQMASIEIKRYTKVLSSDVDEWIIYDAIKSVYTAIYETSKKLVDSTGKLMKFVNSEFPSYDVSLFKDVKKELTKFREDNKDSLTIVRNKIDAHRDEDVCMQIETAENLHLSDAVKLILDYGRIVNELGTVVSPMKQLGILRLESVFHDRNR
ncbi:hypothetical protein F7D42_08145 [Prevotella copri]|uniref:Uncharacterized protein n=1 Tax=Segatella copri TaxID=165179 RepID=A0A6A7VLN7_9BACT|nr:hypothetical protein [Segatella copri]MQN62988.1 hypothetical protein [Segatella copri]MQO55676.1 hypothetical protein [Segatella copri]MQO94064.1 hypothetical protein [Segatella copri]